MVEKLKAGFVFHILPGKAKKDRAFIITWASARDLTLEIGASLFRTCSQMRYLFGWKRLNRLFWREIFGRGTNVLGENRVT